MANSLNWARTSDIEVNSFALYQLSYQRMDDEGLAPTKFKTADLQSAPVAAWVIIQITMTLEEFESS